MKEEINFFGETTFRNTRKKFGIKPDDRRRHVYVVGKTGMGKTALLENMVIQDIQAGKGVGFVDPHGEAAEKLLDFIPSKRVNDVIYFNPADLDYPIAFNVMEKVNVEHRHLVASGLMGVFKKIWPDVWSARMEYILNNSILALLEYPGSTLLGVNRMLADQDYRKKVVEKITDPVVKAFWVTEYARYTQRYEVEATAAIQNKVGQFISNPLIRNIVGQVQSSIDMRKAIDEGKIMILNLSKGRIGEDNSLLLGALLITKIQLAAMSRVDIPEEKRKDFYLYVDEFQNFATASFVNILSEARKYRLCLVLGHQYITQMEEEVRDAVFGNVGTIISFRVGAEDAEYLEKEFAPEFMAADFVNLAKYNIYLKLMIDGLAGRPFSAETLPPLPSPEKSSREKIIKTSRERYATSRKTVEDKISRWTGMMEAAPTTVQASSAASQTLYDAQCALCKKWTKVVFPPDGKRPVYCKNCLKKVGRGPGSAPPPIVVTPRDRNTISLKEALEKPAIPFSPAKKSTEEKPRPKRKEVNLEELKKVLEKSLDVASQKKEETDENAQGL
jgi:CxxC-x17-CxxC domain-containing protein